MESWEKTTPQKLGHDYTIGTLDVLQACDACADMGMTYSVIVQCTDCVVFPKLELIINERRQRWLRHVLRMNDGQLLKHVMRWEVNTTR